MRNYLSEHWRGHHSLARTFWVNLVGLRIVVFMLQNALAPAEGSDYSEMRWPLFALVFAAHGVLLAWQVVGVIRAAERHFASHGNMALVWGAQLGAVLMFVMSAVYALGAVQMSFVSPAEPDTLAQMEAEHANKYRISISDNAQWVHIDGNIELGITRAFRTLLAEQAEISTVVLESPGGNIYEGRGLARLFADQGLNTHVEGTCASACTIAFAGGHKRSATLDARLGFHQYRVDANYAIIATDASREQLRDTELFLRAGVDPQFVAQAFSHPATSMWWPSMDELLSARFIDSVEVLSAHPAD